MSSEKLVSGGLLVGCGRVDPGGGRKLGRTRRLADEALGMSGVGGGEHLGAGVVGVLGLAVVDDLGGQQADARVAVLGVVPAEEVLAEGSGLLDRGEAVREAGAVLQGLELRLGVRVVVRDVGREWVLVTPRSASRKATGLEVIEDPRSAWRVNCPAGRPAWRWSRRSGARQDRRARGGRPSSRPRSGCRRRG